MLTVVVSKCLGMAPEGGLQYTVLVHAVCHMIPELVVDGGVLEPRKLTNPLNPLCNLQQADRLVEKLVVPKWLCSVLRKMYRSSNSRLSGMESLLSPRWICSLERFSMLSFRLSTKKAWSRTRRPRRKTWGLKMNMGCQMISGMRNVFLYVIS